MHSNEQDLQEVGEQIADVALRLRADLQPIAEAVAGEVAAAGQSMADSFAQALDQLDLTPNRAV